MIDVNKITSTLAKLPDQQLQQYAQMHKSDPYIMALAMTESNRRKELRSAGQGAQGMQEQPKVVDQMVAEMASQQLPEEMGIGQLPAGNMNFAGGGIIAFADGGDVERYQVGGMMGDIPGFVAGTGNIIPQAGAPEEEPPLRRLWREFTERNAAARAAERDRRVREGLSAPGTPTAAFSNPAQDLAQFDAASNLYMTERAAKQAANAPKAADAAPVVDTTRKAPGAAAPVAGPRPPAQAGLGDLATVYDDILKKQTYTDPAEAKLAELEKRELSAAEEAKAALLRDQAKFEDAFKGREKRLSDRELDIAKQKDTNTGLAFLNAGLAIMSTPGGLATAIGKGAQVGTAQFAAGLDKIRSAQERLDEARDKMEDLKLNRAEMSAKEIREAEKSIRNVGIDAQKRGIDGIRMAADVNRKTAADMFKATVDVGVNRERIASAESIAAMQERGQNARAGRNPQLDLLEAVSKDPKLAAAYQSMHGKGEDVMGQYNDFLKANPALAMDPQQAMTQFLTSKAVFSQLGKPTVTDKPSTKVRTQP